MSLKKSLKSIFGENRLSNLKGHAFHIGCSVNFALGCIQRFEYQKDYLDVHSILAEENYHVFRGYYDIDYMNRDGNRFLCHRLPLDTIDNKSTKCEIGYYQLDTGCFVKVANTQAWCWQQGSRLRWLDDDHIIFNDVQERGYCARIYNTSENVQSDVINWPLYDSTPDFRYGLTLNFSCLQRLRPGYGYNYFHDTTVRENASDNDGIFLVDIPTRQKRLLYSLNMLAEAVDDWVDYVHYVNHICVSPDGEHFIFFHIYVKPGQKGWKTVLYVSDIHGESLKPLEKRDRCSHYCWIDNERIMVTCRKENGQEYYCVFDICTGEKHYLEIAELSSDGHPSLANDTGEMFITDTYPLKNSLQKIYSFHLSDSHVHEMASMYHDYRLRGEKRCDLHPSISKVHKLLSVDSTYCNGRRSIIIFKIKQN
ncbi:MAG: hypothetical protein LUC91_08570 [Prevotella sp.]|nr:hypothetical protein [Prevotella sp.]